MNPKCPYCGGEMEKKSEYIPYSGGYYSAWYGCPRCKSQSPRCQTYAEAISAATGRYVEPLKPLTLDELDGINGDPVFIQGGDGEEFWIIADKEWMYGIDYDPDFINMEYNDPAGHFGLHVLGWRALKRRPTDAEREAAKWEAQP